MNGFAAYCRSIGENDDPNSNYASVVLLASTSLCAGANQRARLRPGSRCSVAQGVHGENLFVRVFTPNADTSKRLERLELMEPILI